jgi:hypothetical protein
MAEPCKAKGARIAGAFLWFLQAGFADVLRWYLRSMC